MPPINCCVCLSYKWLTKYSIKKLKLDLPRLMLGCTHQKKTVECLRKKVSAKYCSVFPSAEINVGFCRCELPTLCICICLVNVNWCSLHSSLFFLNHTSTSMLEKGFYLPQKKKHLACLKSKLHVLLCLYSMKSNF